MPEEISSLTFQEKVLRASGIVVVEFCAEWCAPCLELEPKLKELATKYQDKAAVYKLDVEDNETITQAYAVFAVPTLVVFSGGHMIGKQVGFSDVDPTGPVKGFIDSELRQRGME